MNPPENRRPVPVPPPPPPNESWTGPKRWTDSVPVAVGIVVAVIILAAVAVRSFGDPPPRSPAADILAVGQVQVVDAAGRPRIIMKCDADGCPRILLIGPDGNPGAALEYWIKPNGDHEPRLGFYSRPAQARGVPTWTVEPGRIRTGYIWTIRD